MNTSDRTRSKTTLERLPKSSIRHLYREHVCPPRNEDKGDMVNTLWRRFNSDIEGSVSVRTFWHAVRLEWEHVDAERRKAIRELNKDGFVREFHPEQS